MGLGQGDFSGGGGGKGVDEGYVCRPRIFDADGSVGELDSGGNMPFAVEPANATFRMKLGEGIGVDCERCGDDRGNVEVVGLESGPVHWGEYFRAECRELVRWGDGREDFNFKVA